MYIRICVCAGVRVCVCVCVYICIQYAYCVFFLMPFSFMRVEILGRILCPCAQSLEEYLTRGSRHSNNICQILQMMRYTKISVPGISLACSWCLIEGSTGEVLLLFHRFPAFHEEIFSLLIVYTAQPEQALTAPVQGRQG